MASTDIVDKIANVCQKWKTMLDEMSEKHRVCAEENRILKLELALAKDRQFQETTVRQFPASVNERLRDLSAHISGHFKH